MLYDVMPSRVKMPGSYAMDGNDRKSSLYEESELKKVTPNTSNLPPPSYDYATKDGLSNGINGELHSGKVADAEEEAKKKKETPNMVGVGETVGDAIVFSVFKSM